MANLKEIKNRINSVASTIQITSAMKLVSAAKLKKAKNAYNSLIPYSSKLKHIISKLSNSIENNQENPYTRESLKENALIVVFSSNKGLCGSFNSNVIKKVKEIINNKSENLKITLATIGKKGDDILKKINNTPFNYNSLFDNDLSFKNTSKVATFIINEFLNKNFDSVTLIYNHFKNVATQEVYVDDFLPINIDKSNGINNSIIYEPSKPLILETLIPKFLKIEFHKVLRDSFVSEHGARMTAMHKATDNAVELKDELTLKFNKERQAGITAEILEIVSGAKVLNN